MLLLLLLVSQMKQARQAERALSSALLSPAHMLGSALKARQPPTSPVTKSPVPFSLSRHVLDDDPPANHQDAPDNHDAGCEDVGYQGDQGDAASDDASAGDVGDVSAEETVIMEPAEEGESAEEDIESTAEEEKEKEKKTVPSPVRSSTASPIIVQIKETGLAAPPEPKSSGEAVDEAKAVVGGGKAVDVSSLHSEVRRLIEAQVVEVLNCGSLQQLLALHGIGPKRAQYIVGKRQAWLCRQLRGGRVFSVHRACARLLVPFLRTCAFLHSSLEYREENASGGGFADIADLKHVGMPAKHIDKIARMLVHQQLGAF